MKRIYLIDCPGVVPPSNGDTEEDILLRGVVRIENVENPAQYIPAVIRRTQTKHLERTYNITHAEYNDDTDEFLGILARKGGRLLKGGEADIDGVAKMVLNDFLRGKIPWFCPPPPPGRADGESSTRNEQGQEKQSLPQPEKATVDGCEGKPGKMLGNKRKRGEQQEIDGDRREFMEGEHAETQTREKVRSDHNRDADDDNDDGNSA